MAVCLSEDGSRRTGSSSAQKASHTRSQIVCRLLGFCGVSVVVCCLCAAFVLGRSVVRRVIEVVSPGLCGAVVVGSAVVLEASVVVSGSYAVFVVESSVTGGASVVVSVIGLKALVVVEGFMVRGA